MSTRLLTVFRRGSWAWLAASAAAHAGVALALVRGAALVRADAPAATPPRESVLAGETFELPSDTETPDPGSVDAPATPETPSPSPAAVPVPGREDGVAAPTPPAPARAAAHRRASRTGRPSAFAAAPPPPPLFGAVGDRSAVDLATAFTRSFPIAASADPQWARAPFGAAGEADLVVSLDGSGAIADVRVVGAPPAALNAGVQRTLALIRARLFTARGASTRLHLRARVSPDEVHDGLHGDVFAVGGSFVANAREGSAFFSLAIGRRVDLYVAEKR